MIGLKSVMDLGASPTLVSGDSQRRQLGWECREISDIYLSTLDVSALPAVTTERHFASVTTLVVTTWSGDCRASFLSSW